MPNIFKAPSAETGKKEQKLPPAYGDFENVEGQDIEGVIAKIPDVRIIDDIKTKGQLDVIMRRFAESYEAFEKINGRDNKAKVGRFLYERLDRAIKPASYWAEEANKLRNLKMLLSRFNTGEAAQGDQIKKEPTFQ